MERLPLMDEHTTTVAAPRATVWSAVEEYARGLSQADHGVLGRLLQPAPQSGFAMGEAISGESLALEGRHRFARYRLVFALAEQPDRTTTLKARSYGVFPGLGGGLYRALLIGSHGHVLTVRHMLRSIRRKCE